ncbi:MAG: exodeoxyribonuclease VII large subunit [Ruminococcaceae bacterium]|nr:exodeoxyribonuclease VII large subunit [Oscillospiraceae bacterium]
MSKAITLTVSQLNEYIKALLDSQDLLGDIYIKGEISNFTNHYKSGHLYFSVKDSESVVKAVMFRSYASTLKFEPENGMKVIVRGSVSVFPRDGVYQIYAKEIQPDGIGSLYLAYEQLKEKLYSMGLFDEAHKKPIPRYPSKIGIITADTGAAVADMKNILTRRYPVSEIYIYPSLVQGSGAPKELCEGIRFFNEKFPVDTIIIGRGGGSIEDLWAFNSEMLAHEIYNSHIPVISAVGHETDFTICDFVADLRAPTPSAAAELAVPESSEILSTIAGYASMFKTLSEAKIRSLKNELAMLSKSKMFTSPLFYTERLNEKTANLSQKLLSSISKICSEKKSSLSEKTAKIAALSPLSVMARGYSIISKDDGHAVTSVNQLNKGETLDLRFCDGSAKAEITQITKGDKN